MSVYHAIPDVPGLAVIVRGWLHGNTVVLSGPVPAVLDTGYESGVEELIELLADDAGLAGLSHIYLTHVHSDHAGGCAPLRRRTGATIHAHPDCRDLVERWDPRALWLEGMGQHMEPFRVDRLIRPGEDLETNRLRWQVLSTGGHAVGGVSFYEPHYRVLVSGDALWEHGLGVLLPARDGPGVFDAARRALDTLAPLDVALVIPGHGRPFTDFAGALERARESLATWQAHPERMLRHNFRSGLAFWLLAHDGEDRDALEAIVRAFLDEARQLADAAAVQRVVDDLLQAGALELRGDRVHAGPRIQDV